MARKDTPSVVIEEVTDENASSKERDESVPKPSNTSNSGGVEEDSTAITSSADASAAESETNGLSGSKELTEEEVEKLAEAEKLKGEGNKLYSDGKCQEALEKYSEALNTAPEKATQQRAVYFANSAAARLKLQHFADAAKDASAALELEPPTSLQIKALIRRSNAYEKLDDLDRALMDMEKVVELDGSNAAALSAVKRLKPIVEERREKMKDEMIDKLKELGNTVLGKFGMSLDNFKAEKDPTTGSYSINFKQ